MKRLLFLCTGNYYRSRFAEELFNYRVATTGLSWRASSRALGVEYWSEEMGPISHHTLNALNLLGIPVAGSGRLPRQCSTEELEAADIVVALKELEHRPMLTAKHPGWEDKVIYWHVNDIAIDAPAKALSEMSHLVSALIAGLAKQVD